MDEAISAAEIVALLPSLRSYALALTQSDHKADDLVQDTLERAWRNRERFIAGESPKAWLCTIMRNRFIDGVRADKWTVEDVDGQSAAKQSSNPSQQWRLHYSDLLRAIDLLSPSTGEVVALCWFGGLTHQDAAKVLDWPLGTVKARIRRAKEFLTQTLDLGFMEASDYQG